MPELPEVESVARSLRARLPGRRVEAVATSGLPLRAPVDARRLRRAAQGARFVAVDRMAKYLLLRLDGGGVLLSHLGMTGCWLFQPHRSAAPPHTHVRLVLDDGNDLRYVDPRRFGVLRVFGRPEEAEASPELAILGVDPLGPAFTPAWLAATLAAARTPLKAFLLDQRRIAGLGNIYVAEALHAAGLSPLRASHRVDAEGARRLHGAVRRVLRSAIRRRGTSFSDYVDAEGEQGNNQHHLAVYGREGEPCPRCAGTIRRVTQGGRSTFYCPKCQR